MILIVIEKAHWIHLFDNGYQYTRKTKHHSIKRRLIKKEGE